MEESERVLRQTDVLVRLAISRNTLFRLRARGEFPDPVRLGIRAIGWPESALNAWIAGRQRHLNS